MHRRLKTTASRPRSEESGEHEEKTYAAGGTPCAAAHSTTRALFASYNVEQAQLTRR
ncbi:arabinofuranosidase catalytic domain-containing protein [Microbispora sp. NPDC046933]|uniref:arabinofuranosidase catalytic domain-containing protein n=1 Tax=Microbispora sp. NPDC046933 TaxID=3155618 RepID=UPI0033F27A1E